MGTEQHQAGPLVQVRLPFPTPIPDSPSMPSGGAGLYSTAEDYSKALVALLAGGGGLLKPDSVKQLRDAQLPDNKYLMAEFHGPWHDAICPEYPKDMPASYGLGGALNLEDIPQKRRKGSLMWSGMANTHWVSLKKCQIVLRNAVLTIGRSGSIGNPALQRRCSCRSCHLSIVW